MRCLLIYDFVDHSWILHGLIMKKILNYVVLQDDFFLLPFLLLVVLLIHRLLLLDYLQTFIWHHFLFILSFLFEYILAKLSANSLLCSKFCIKLPNHFQLGTDIFLPSIPGICRLLAPVLRFYSTNHIFFSRLYAFWLLLHFNFLTSNLLHDGYSSIDLYGPEWMGNILVTLAVLGL